MHNPVELELLVRHLGEARVQEAPDVAVDALGIERAELIVLVGSNLAETMPPAARHLDRLREADIRDPFGLTYWPEFKGRDGSRTPMPWRGDLPHAGFTAPRSTPWLPVAPIERATGQRSRKCALRMRITSGISSPTSTPISPTSA